MPRYTTVQRIAQQLNWLEVDDDGVTKIIIPDADSIPSKEYLDEVIDSMESFLEEYTNSFWYDPNAAAGSGIDSPKTITNEYHTFWYGRRSIRYGIMLQLMQPYPLPLDGAEGDKLEVYIGQEWFDIVANGTVGGGPLDGSWFLEPFSGLLYINNDFPTRAEDNIRVTYRAGKTPIPAAIKRASTLLVASDLIVANFDWTHQMIESGDGMNNATKSERWREQAELIMDRFAASRNIPQW